MRRCIVSVAVLVALVVGAGTALAQNAQITGTLKDQSGGVLPGVTVTAKNQASGLTRVAVTEASGRVPARRADPGGLRRHHGVVRFQLRIAQGHRPGD